MKILKFKKIIGVVLSHIGIFSLVSPFLLYWWIHGDYERYLWIINGPFPYSHLGGGPFQLQLFAGLFIFGAACIIVSIKMQGDLFGQSQ